MKKYWVLTLLIAIATFFLGRLSNRTVEKEVYKKEPTIQGQAVISLPKKEILPEQPTLPIKYIFVNDVQVQMVDTAKIIEEYAKEKTYDVRLFDNEYGSLDLKPTLQYNTLMSMPYSFNPISKTVTKKEVFSFFGAASYNTFNIAGLGGGFFYHNFGFEYKYLYRINTNQTGHEFGIKMKF